VHARSISPRDERQIAEAIGADWLVYQDLDDLIEAVAKGNPEISRFDTSCFDGNYVTGDITPEYLEQLERERNDEAREQVCKVDDDVVIDLYNNK